MTIARVLRKMSYWSSEYEWQIIRTSGQEQDVVGSRNKQMYRNSETSRGGAP
jgi:hypothetical protein